MDPLDQHRRVFQIVAGSAWVDGTIDPREQDYLERLLRRYQLDHDQELRALLATPIQITETERWILSYLARANPIERQQLLGAIGNLMIADEQISEPEHILLDEYHLLLEQIPPQPEIAAPQVAKALRHFVQRVVQAVTG